MIPTIGHSGKVKTMETTKRSVVTRSSWEVRDEQDRSTDNCQGSETIVCDAIRVDTCHYKWIQTHRMYNTLSELLMAMVCQCGFISCNKCTMLAGNIIEEEPVHTWKQVGIRETCTFHSLVLRT